MYVIFLLISGIIFSFLLLLISPLKISLNFNVTNYKLISSVDFIFIRPNILYVSFDSQSHKVKVLFFGKMITKSAKKSNVKKNIWGSSKEEEPAFFVYKRDLKEEGSSYTTKEKKEDILSVSAPSEKNFFKKEKIEEIKEEKKRERKEDERLKILFSFLNNSKWRKKIWGWIKRVFFSLFKSTRCEHFYISIIAGLEDPEITGYLTGAYYLLGNIVGNIKNKQIVFTPIFMKNHFELSSTISLSTSLLKIILPFFFVFLTFPYLYTFFLWRKVSR